MKIIIIGVDYAIKSYMHIHKEVLQKNNSVDLISIDRLISGFNRRSINTLKSDLKIVIKFLKEKKPIYVISIGPKTGFLISISSIILGYKQIHWFTGQYWANKKFPFLSYSFYVDFIINLIAYKSITDGPSQALFLKKNLPRYFQKEVYSIPKGSISGVNNKLTKIGINRYRSIISNKGFISNRKLRVGFLGRITEDKGISIIKNLSKEPCLKKHFNFLIAGPSDISFSKLNKSLKNNIYPSDNSLEINVGYQNNSSFFKSVDIFILPSKREGFGSSVLESQACAVPVISSNIYGLKDSLPDSAGGIKCLKYSDYKKALIKFIEYEFYKKMAEKAIRFALYFRQGNFKKRLEEVYEKYI